jgi:hypothetical protein
MSWRFGRSQSKKGGDIYICQNKLVKSVDIQDGLGIEASRLMNVMRS